MSPEQEGVLSGHVVAVAVLIGHEVSLGHEAEFGHLPALEAPPQVVRHSERQCLQGGDDVYAVPMYNGNIKGIGRKGNNVHATVVSGGPLGENDGGAA